MLNIVTGPEKYPAAVLIRGTVLNNRDGRKIILNGPGKITKFLKITKARAGMMNGKITGRKTGLWIEDRKIKIKSQSIIKSPRIGIPYAGAWTKKPWRFSIKYYDTIS